MPALGRLEGLRPAEAGEFTRRAFENGKLDLTAVEGLADLVMAETQAQRRQALRQLHGLLGNRAEAWRQKLIKALALVEARIDFSDEADVPEDLLQPALKIARELRDEIAGVLADGGRGESLRDGLVVAIAGPPNAGKSTLLNRLARREAAIVSPYAGTTRDIIEVHLDLGGLPVTLLDTAGIRETDDPVELEGVRRARERASGADLVLWVEDASGPLADRAEMPAAPAIWRLRNKIDLVTGKNGLGFKVSAKNEPGTRPTERLTNMVNEPLVPRTEQSFGNHEGQRSVNEQSIESGFRYNELQFTLSALTGEGFDALLAALGRYAENFLAGAETALLTRERHRRALQDTEAALGRALGLSGREDLIAEELRLAARALGRLTGRVDVEDILDVIFRDFCIGK